MPAQKRAICSIIAKNYLAHARVLAETWQKHHPDIPVYVLLVDRVNGHFDPVAEPFHLIEVEDLQIAELPGMAARYDVQELCTAVKPSLLQYLFTQGFDEVCYFDPDIAFFQPIDSVWQRLASHNAVVTPHLLGPIDEEHIPNEFTILHAGAYNLGFIALKRTEQIESFVEWWRRRLVQYAHAKPQTGQHFDQKWISLLSSFVDDVYIDRYPGHNAAYWDLTNRRITKTGEFYYCNGEPLVFYHFSGYSPERPGVISKHQNRFTFANHPDLKSLFDDYRFSLWEQGYKTVHQWPYELLGKRYSLGSGRLRGVGASLRKVVLMPGPLLYGYLSNKIIERGWHEPLLRIFGERLITAVRAFFFEIRLSSLRRVRAANRNPSSYSDGSLGFNILGHLGHETGTGEVARSFARALHATGIPVAWHSVDPHNPEYAASELRGIPTGHPYNTTLVYVNADSVESQLATRHLYDDGQHRMIGNWWWELADFPSRWKDSFSYFDELWVGSRFVYDSLRPHTDLPITVVGVPIEWSGEYPSPRQALNISQNKFMYLFIFDITSYLERKNPYALIEAFRRAFGESSTEAVLVIKVTHTHKFPEQTAQLKQELESIRGILIEDNLPRRLLNALTKSCDAYISLHRSEGFGLTIAEAMYFGRPVIATNYSGPTDYMTEANSFPISYYLTPLPRSIGPYPAGGRWAEPDVEEASWRMRYVFENAAEAKSRGVQAAADIRAQYGYHAVTQRMLTRLRELS